MHVMFLILLAWVGVSHYQREGNVHGAFVGIVFILAVFGTVLLHELGHALTARRFDVKTKDVTLYPIGGVARLERDLDCKHENLSDAERLQHFRVARDQIRARLDVLAALRDVPPGPDPREFHASIRVPDLADAARFYAWLLGVSPREWTHRYVTFVSEALRTNFVLLVADGKELHQDTLYHLGVDVGTKDAAIESHHRAEAAGWLIEKPARTTWRGTPLHELWLKDPGGNLVEIYARVTAAELVEKPENLEPSALT